MPFSLGFWAAAGAVGPSDFELISSQILSGNATSVTFSSIPQTYRHLQLRIVALGTAGNGTSYTFNGDGVANYSMHRMNPDTGGNNLNSFGASNTSFIQTSGLTAGFSTGIPLPIVIDVLDYASTSKNKTSRHIVGQTGSSINEFIFGSGLWRSTAAITSITFGSGNSMLTGSRFSLYGIKG